uniref:RsmB/NOP family class I SAM-dependent RNA methyltransferase n=1 Tax=Actinotalea sp. TaxID=1872145 RepID=UPI00356949DB
MSQDERRDGSGRQRGRARVEGRTQRSAAAPSGRARHGDPARAAAFEVLRQVDGSDAYANLVLPPLLRSRHLTGRDAAFATELAYGTLRLQGRYDAILAIATGRPIAQLDAPVRDVLRLGAHQLLGMRVPAHAAVSETVALTRALVGAGPAQLVNAALRRVSEKELDAWLALLTESAQDDTERLAVVHSHPAWIVRAFRQALAAEGRDPGELEALLEADNAAPAVTLVVRPGLADRDQVLAGLSGGEAGRWTPTAIRMAAGDPAQVAGVAGGRVGVQDEGSQLVALALASAPTLPGAGTAGAPVGERWLDLCAGPGGKSALLGAVASAAGAHLVANEIAPHRAALVERSVAALPPGTVEVRTGDGTTIGAQEPGVYDRVLVDAPCTGLGALRRRPESRWRRTPGDLGRLSTLQRELLSSALDATRPGGVVAYVT